MDGKDQTTEKAGPEREESQQQDRDQPADNGVQGHVEEVEPERVSIPDTPVEGEA